MENRRVKKIKVEQYHPDWVQCPNCLVKFNLEDRNQWSGILHRTCGQKIDVEGYVDKQEFIWCVKANICEDSNRIKTGSKVYLFTPEWDVAHNSFKVVGKDFETNKFIEIVLSLNKLDHFKIEKVTKSDLKSRLNQFWSDDQRSIDRANELIEYCNNKKMSK